MPGCRSDIRLSRQKLVHPAFCQLFTIRNQSALHFAESGCQSHLTCHNAIWIRVTSADMLVMIADGNAPSGQSEMLFLAGWVFVATTLHLLTLKCISQISVGLSSF